MDQLHIFQWDKNNCCFVNSLFLKRITEQVTEFLSGWPTHWRKKVLESCFCCPLTDCKIECNYFCMHWIRETVEIVGTFSLFQALYVGESLQPVLHLEDSLNSFTSICCFYSHLSGTMYRKSLPLQMMTQLLEKINK